MANIQEHDKKVIAEWTRIFRFSRNRGFNVEQSMKNASLFITEEYDIIHPEMFNVPIKPAG